MLIVDARGDIVHGVSTSDTGPRVGRAAIGNVSDREYFRVPMTTGQVYVSPAFRGRVYSNASIVAISAPVRGPGGRPIGIVEGSLNLNQFSRFNEHGSGLPDDESTRRRPRSVGGVNQTFRFGLSGSEVRWLVRPIPGC
jgi:hypothetical protein